MRKKIVWVLFLSVLIFSNFITAKPAPPEVQAELLVKMLNFNKNIIETSNNISIHVVDAPEVAKALRTHIGKPIGTATLFNITEGNTLPTEGDLPVALYIGSIDGYEKLNDLLFYTQENKILSVTGDEYFMDAGVTLTIYMEKNKPAAILNILTSKEENINWNPQAVLKFAQPIKIPVISPKRIPKAFVPMEAPPSPKKTVSPNYPELARRAGISGTVQLSVHVNEKGQVDAIEVVQSVQKGKDGCDDEAVRAVRKWVFNPAKFNGQGVAVWTNVPITFGK